MQATGLGRDWRLGDGRLKAAFESCQLHARDASPESQPFGWPLASPVLRQLRLAQPNPLARGPGVEQPAVDREAVG